MAVRTVCGAVAVLLVLSAKGVRVTRKAEAALDQQSASCGAKGASTPHSGSPAVGNGINTSIVNGQPATECAWKWQVGLWNEWGGSNAQFCGGMLIRPDWVLTAAHCLGQPGVLTVVAGDYNLTQSSSWEQRSGVVQIFPHPEYGTAPTRFDIALVRLRTPMQLGDCVGTVCLPIKGSDVQPGARCWITGWGALQHQGSYPEILQEGQVETLSSRDCWQRFGYNQSELHSSMLCAQGTHSNGEATDACQGDSGGPLVCEQSGVWRVYGATSWGARCGDPEFPGVWSRVHSVVDWIDESIQGNSGAFPQCPRFAKSRTPSLEGDCECLEPQICSTNGVDWNCPTAGSAPGSSSRKFYYSCENCRCQLPRTCPSFAAHQYESFFHMCQCPLPQFCTTNGADKDCPRRQHASSSWFNVGCANCECKEPAQEPMCPNFAMQPQPFDDLCMCPFTQICSTNGRDANCPDAVGNLGSLLWPYDCDECRCINPR